MTGTPLLLVVVVAAGILAAGCGGKCGPRKAVVTSVIDGDTIELDSGDSVRYLMVDTPEVSGGTECYGSEARTFNADLVEGQEVKLEYDEECSDRFGRLLAYVSVGDREVNTLLVERGFACVFYVAPNGEDRLAEFEELELGARADDRGMWGACTEVSCAN